MFDRTSLRTARLKTVELETGLGDKVLLRALSVAQLRELQEVSARHEADKYEIALGVAFSLVNPDGTYMFDATKVEDLDEVNELPLTFLTLVTSKVKELNGLGAIEEKKTT